MIVICIEGGQRMLAFERREAITVKIEQDKKVLVSDLSKLFDVSEETIRRDLEKLEIGK